MSKLLMQAITKCKESQLSRRVARRSKLQALAPKPPNTPWTEAEESRFRKIVRKHGADNVAGIARRMGTRDEAQIRNYLKSVKLSRDFLDAMQEFDVREMLRYVEGKLEGGEERG